MAKFECGLWRGEVEGGRENCRFGRVRRRGFDEIKLSPKKTSGHRTVNYFMQNVKHLLESWNCEDQLHIDWKDGVNAPVKCANVANSSLKAVSTSAHGASDLRRTGKALKQIPLRFASLRLFD